MQLYYATHRAFSMDLHSQMALTDVYDFSMGLYLLVLVYSLLITKHRTRLKPDCTGCQKRPAFTNRDARS
jgi:hypothetical protein